MLSNSKRHLRPKLLLGGVLLCVLVFIIWPLPTTLKNSHIITPLQIVDRTGIPLYEVRNEQFGGQIVLPLAQIPADVLKTLLATEDRTFYWHIGVSVRGTLRAAWQNVSRGRVVSGGSTITQQLVRNRLQPTKRDFFYKIKEALLAIKLELTLRKTTILESYINTVYFGHQAYGIGAAAHVYFGKSVHELSLAETTLLIGLLQSPSSLDPFYNFEAAKKRQLVVLRSLYDTNKIAANEYAELAAEPLILTKDKVRIKAPHFVMWLLQQGGAHLPADNVIQTTIDSGLQTSIESIIEYQLARLADKNVTSAAVIVLDATTGELLSMVGSADYFNTENDGQVNVATALRQPGSTLKPFTYGLALTNGQTVATTVADTDIQLLTQSGNPYTPRNYDYEHHGLVRYREALANSYNIPAIKVAQKVGIATLLNVLRAAGITSLTKSPEFYGLALTLGNGEVSLLELTQAYGMLANRGRFLPIQVMRPVQSVPENSPVVFSESVTWLLTNILSDSSARIAEFGLSNALNFDFPVAAKTGTTRNARDNWVIGYTPQRIVGVWVGNANNEPMIGTSGITGAGPIFHDVMQQAMSNLPITEFAIPADITSTTICRLSGKLPTEHCTHTMNEYFIKGTEPKQTDTMYQPIAIDTRNGLRATEDCTARFKDTKTFIVFPSELQLWAQQQGYTLPPQTYSPLCTGVSNIPIESNIKEDMHITIVKPAMGTSFLLDPLVPDDQELVILEAQASASIVKLDWFVNGVPVGTGMAPNYKVRWQPSIGTAHIEARYNNLKDAVTITVQK